jgi:co-chaperonin GroES (HSP10)
MLKPTSDWVVTKVVKEEDTVTAGGLFLVRPLQQTTKCVEIISFGPEANKYGDLKVGDIVVTAVQMGIKTVHEDVEYELAKEKNFLGVVEKEG